MLLLLTTNQLKNSQSTCKNKNESWDLSLLSIEWRKRELKYTDKKKEIYYITIKHMQSKTATI